MHTKRIAAGKGKKPVWLTTTKAGAHSKDNSLTLLGIVRDEIGYADNAREAKTIINSGLILVDKKIRREASSPVGIMDLVEIPKLKKYYRVLPGAKGPKLKEIPSSESNLKPCKILDKKSLKKGLVQLNLHDGTTIVLNKDTFKTKDTVILELPSRKIKDALEYKKGSTALIIKGRHAGATGAIQEINPATESVKAITKVGDIQTLTDYAFVVGKDKPSIAI